MLTKRFQRKIENFTCEHCGSAVIGTGYTNHCPTCLWSKHVDVNPGDRLATCGGLMEPKNVEGTSAEYKIVYVCMRCGFTKRNQVQAEDSVDALISIAEKKI